MIVLVGVLVGVSLLVGVTVEVGVTVLVGVLVGVIELVGVLVGVLDGVTVFVGVGLCVGAIVKHPGACELAPASVIDIVCTFVNADVATSSTLKTSPNLSNT